MQTHKEIKVVAIAEEFIIMNKCYRLLTANLQISHDWMSLTLHPTFNTFFRNKCEIKLTHPSKSGKLFFSGLLKGVCHHLADYAGCCRIGQIPLYPKEMFMCLFKIVEAYKHVSQFFAKCLFTKHSKRL